MYKKYSDLELMQAYQGMMDYSGKLTNDLLTEIDARGGMEVFLKKMQETGDYQKEIWRVRREVHLLACKDTDPEFIRKTVKSDLLKDENIDALVQYAYAEQVAYTEDRKVTPKTLTGSLIGIITGIVLSGLFLWAVSRETFRYVLILLIPAYWLNYFIIRFITRQSRNNIVVFTAAFIATVGGALFALFLLKTF